MSLPSGAKEEHSFLFPFSTVLDMVGLVPIVGDLADGVNTVIYVMEGDLANAAFSGIALIPIGGIAVIAGKYTYKGVKKGIQFINNTAGFIDLSKFVFKNGDEIVEGFTKGGSDGLESLSRSQKRNVETLNNVIENNLKDHDFSGTLRDLQGNPVPKPNGGFWDHKTEMIQSYDALTGVKNGLEGSLKNPNLTSETRMFLQEELDKVNSYIQKIDELFEPYGGVK